MKPSTERVALIGFSAIGMIAIFLILLADRLGWPSFKELMLHSATAAWIQAIGSVVAIFVAAWVVHRQHVLEVQRWEDQRIQGQVEAINGALLMLLCQLEALAKFRKQILEPERNNPARHLALSATGLFEFSHWIIDWKTLAFLLSTNTQTALLGAVRGYEAFHSAIQSANDRSRFHQAEFQPQVDLASLDLDVGVDIATLENAVGPRVTHTMRAMTNILYDQVDVAISLLEKAGALHSVVLREEYKGHHIIKFSLPPEV